MSIETIMKLQVGDGIDAQSAMASIICTDGVFAGSETITVTPPEMTAITFTQGTSFTGGSGDNALAVEIKDLINSISGLIATVENNIVTIQTEAKGDLASGWDLSTNAGSFFSLVNFQGEREADLPKDLEISVESDGNLVARLDDVILFRVPFSEVYEENKKTFEQNLRDFIRKAQC